MVFGPEGGLTEAEVERLTKQDGVHVRPWTENFKDRNRSAIRVERDFLSNRVIKR